MAGFQDGKILIDSSVNIKNKLDRQNHITEDSDEKDVVNVEYLKSKLEDLENNINNQGFITNIGNIGDGQTSLVDKTTTDPYKIRTIKSIGSGTSIYRGLDNESHTIASLSSNTLNITSNQDGSVQIDSAQDNFGVKAYYVNSNYTGIVEDGSIIRPYKNLTNAVNAVIGNGTRLQPENEFSRIILQTSEVTDVDLEINSTDYELQDVTLEYIGIKEFIIDTSILVDTAPKNPDGSLQYAISFGIRGNGTLKNEGANAIGIIKHKAYSVPNQTNIFKSNFYILGANLKLEEKKPDFTLYSPVTDEGGNQIYREGRPMIGQNTMGSTGGLIQVEGSNCCSAESMYIEDSKIQTILFKQIAIYAKGDSYIYLNRSDFYIYRSFHEVNFENVQYFGTTRSYVPKLGIYDIYIKDLSAIFLTSSSSIVTVENTYNRKGGVEAFCKLENGSAITSLGKNKIIPYFYNNLCLYNGSGCSWVVRDLVYSGLTFDAVFKGDGVNNLNNDTNYSTIRIFNYEKSSRTPLYSQTNIANSENIYLEGVFYSTTIPTFNSNATALAGGLIKNMQYKTPTGELRIVV